MNHNAWPTPPQPVPENQPQMVQPGSGLNPDMHGMVPPPAAANMAMPTPQSGEAPQPPRFQRTREIASKFAAKSAESASNLAKNTLAVGGLALKGVAIGGKFAAEKAAAGAKYIAEDTKDSLRKPTWEGTGLPEATEELKMAARGIGRVALGTKARIHEHKAAKRLREADKLLDLDPVAINEPDGVSTRTLRKAGLSRKQARAMVAKSRGNGVYTIYSNPTKVRIDPRTGALHAGGEEVETEDFQKVSTKRYGEVGLDLTPEGVDPDLFVPKGRIKLRTSDPHPNKLSDDQQKTVGANLGTLTGHMRKLIDKEAASRTAAERARIGVDLSRRRDDRTIRKKRIDARLEVQGEIARRNSLSKRRKAAHVVLRPGGLVERRVRRGKPLVHGSVTNPRR